MHDHNRNGININVNMWHLLVLNSALINAKKREKRTLIFESSLGNPNLFALFWPMEAILLLMEHSNMKKNKENALPYKSFLQSCRQRRKDHSNVVAKMIKCFNSSCPSQWALWHAVSLNTSRVSALFCYSKIEDFEEIIACKINDK